MPLWPCELHAPADAGRGVRGRRRPAAEAAPTGAAVSRTRAANSLLVIKLADLGDALTATPALRALRQTWPSARIDVLTSAIGREALAGLDSIDRIHVADKHRFDAPGGLLSPAAWLDLLPLLRELRGQRYEQLLLMHHLT